MPRDIIYVRRRSHNGTKLENFGPEDPKDHPYRLKKPVLSDRRISICGVCRAGIFEDHEYEWTGCGYLHKWCIKDEDESATPALPDN